MRYNLTSEFSRGDIRGHISVPCPGGTTTESQRLSLEQAISDFMKHIAVDFPDHPPDNQFDDNVLGIA